MQVISLASGSSGNSFLIRIKGSSLLVDAGLSGKQIRERLDRVGVDPESLSGILVSHGHSDHVKGVGVLSRKYKLPVWMNRGTWEVVRKYTGILHRLEIFETGRIFELAGFRVHPFSVPHDCAEPVGFRICSGAASVGIATDLGVATGLVANILTGLQAVVLESNHDLQMLRNGPYPWELKQRVSSRLGHLSNTDSAKLLQRIFSDELRAVILAHVSTTNNLPELAMNCARDSLRNLFDTNGNIWCARQDEVGPAIEI